jgi:hypothetical protein
MPYCLRTNIQLSEINLGQILETKHFELIKKTYYLENVNALLILVKFETDKYIKIFLFLVLKKNLKQ